MSTFNGVKSRKVVQKRMDQCSISTKNIAFYLKVSEKAVENWLKGKHRFNYCQVFKLCELLNLETSELL